MSPWTACAILASLLGLIWAVVYAAGGARTALPHLFYLPIVLSVLPFRFAGTTITALTAAVLCGPLMPLDTIAGDSQPLGNWVLRGLMFFIVGGVTSLAVMARKHIDQVLMSAEITDAMTEKECSGSEVDTNLVPLVAGMLASRTFHPVFQPVYSLADGRLLAVEALTRFDSEPYRTPDLWFAAAAEAGCGTDLEIAAIEEALAASPDLSSDVSLALNASPSTLGDTRLLELIAAHADRKITLEITEHAVVEDYYLLQNSVQKLRDHGVRIAVDDAGSGISSLRHIVQLAPETIKLDISLVQGVGTSPLRRALAGSLIGFAKRIGAQLIVEGVEEVSDLTTWTALGADAVQGYLVGRPGSLPVADVSRLIASLRGRRF